MRTARRVKHTLLPQPRMFGIENSEGNAIGRRGDCIRGGDCGRLALGRSVHPEAHAPQDRQHAWARRRPKQSVIAWSNQWVLEVTPLSANKKSDCGIQTCRGGLCRSRLRAIPSSLAGGEGPQAQQRVCVARSGASWSNQGVLTRRLRQTKTPHRRGVFIWRRGGDSNPR